MRFLYLMVTIAMTTCSEECSKDDHRSKRQINGIPLVYPYGGTYKLLVGMTTPIENKDHVNIVFGINFQYQYLQFQNITQLSQYYFVKDVSRSERDTDIEHRKTERLVFYKAIEDLLETRGFNGHQCVLRAICEVAQHSLEDEGLVGEIVHILLTPDYGHSSDSELLLDEDLASYVDAAEAGRQIFSCPALFSGCPEGRGVLELISILTDD